MIVKLILHSVYLSWLQNVFHQEAKAISIKSLLNKSEKTLTDLSNRNIKKTVKLVKNFFLNK